MATTTSAKAEAPQVHRDPVGTVRREDHDPNGPHPGHTIWVQMREEPKPLNRRESRYWIAIYSTAPGNVAARTDMFDPEAASWPIESWPIVGAIPGTPAAEQVPA